MLAKRKVAGTSAIARTRNHPLRSNTSDLSMGRSASAVAREPLDDHAVTDHLDCLDRVIPADLHVEGDRHRCSSRGPEGVAGILAVGQHLEERTVGHERPARDRGPSTSPS